MAPHPALRTTRILWFALLLSVFLYAGLPFTGLLPPAKGPPLPIMSYALAAMSLALAVTSFLLPKTIYSGALRATQVETTEEVAPSAFSEQYRAATPKARVFVDPNAAKSKAYAVFFTPFILSLALSEAIALFGLVLASLGFDKVVYLPFFGVGAVLIALRFPNEASILAAFERAHGASFPAPR